MGLNRRIKSLSWSFRQISGSFNLFRITLYCSLHIKSLIVTPLSTKASSTLSDTTFFYSEIWYGLLQIFLSAEFYANESRHQTNKNAEHLGMTQQKDFSGYKHTYIRFFCIFISCIYFKRSLIKTLETLSKGNNPFFIVLLSSSSVGQ